MVDETECILGYDYSELKDLTAVTIGKRINGKIIITKILYGEEAEKMLKGE